MADKRFHSLLRDEAPLDELQDGDGQSGHGRPEGRARRHDKVQWQRWCSRLADVERRSNEPRQIRAGYC